MGLDILYFQSLSSLDLLFKQVLIKVKKESDSGLSPESSSDMNLKTNLLQEGRNDRRLFLDPIEEELEELDEEQIYSRLMMLHED